MSPFVDHTVPSPADHASPQEDELRVERLLAHARLLLALIAAVAVRFVPEPVATLGAAPYLFPAIYGVFAACLFVGLRRFPDRILPWRTVVHVLDVAAVGFCISFTGGPSSPATLFLFFVLLGAALRWGFQPTLLTGVATVVWYLADRLLAAGASTTVVSRSLLSAAFLLAATLMIAWVAGSEAAVRGENRLVSLMLAQLKSRNGFTDPLQEILSLCLAHMGADCGLLALENEKTGRLYVWSSRRYAKSQETNLSLAELRSADRDSFFFDLP